MSLCCSKSCNDSMFHTVEKSESLYPPRRSCVTWSGLQFPLCSQLVLLPSSWPPPLSPHYSVWLTLEIVQFLEHSSVLLHQGLCSVVSLVWHVLAWEVCELTTASLQISCRCDVLPLVPCLKCLVCPNPILISTPSSPNPVFILIFE